MTLLAGCAFKPISVDPRRNGREVRAAQTGRNDFEGFCLGSCWWAQKPCTNAHSFEPSPKQSFGDLDDIQ